MAIENWISGSNLLVKAGFALYDVSSSWHHAMLVREVVPGSAQQGLQVKVAHMGPPLLLGATVRLAAPAHLIAWFPECSDDELDEILAELERLENLMPPNPAGHSAYHLGTHQIEESANAGGIVIRASCASLIEHCYARIEIDLVDESAVPSLSLEELSNLIQQDSKVIERMLRMMRVQIKWPCPILLPGYQMNAFRHGWPRKPQPSDHPFK